MNNGRAFENECAIRLMQDGWTVSTTKTVGDQGADLVATRGKISVSIQCKDYAKPVGNKAIQEAFSAKSYYGTDSSAVISRSGFTKSAQLLAEKTSVHLLSLNAIEGLKYHFAEDDPSGERIHITDDSLQRNQILVRSESD